MYFRNSKQAKIVQTYLNVRNVGKMIHECYSQKKKNRTNFLVVIIEHLWNANERGFRRCIMDNVIIVVIIIKRRKERAKRKQYFLSVRIFVSDCNYKKTRSWFYVNELEICLQQKNPHRSEWSFHYWLLISTRANRIIFNGYVWLLQSYCIRVQM